MMASFYGPDNPVTGKSVLSWVIAFFVVIFAANAAFVYFALSSWPGLSTENAYELGLRHNNTLAAGETQRKLGWRSGVALVKGNQIQVRFSDRSRAPLAGLKVSVTMIRPSHEGHDVAVDLTEVAPGLYTAPVNLALKGHWMVEVRASDQADNRYKLIHEIDIAP